MTEKNYLCDDGHCELRIAATSAQEAAEDYVDGGDWGVDDHTVWITVRVAPADDPDEREAIKIAVHPDEPPCNGAAHDWTSPIELVGGCVENPGVRAHDGGVIIHEVCPICGTSRYTDTWAQDPATGEQGLDSVRYEGA